MIEQLVLSNPSQNSFANMDLNNQPLPANAGDVMKFDMAFRDQKVENNSLLDVSTKTDGGFLQIQTTQETNPIIKMDQEYQSILVRMKEMSGVDKRWDILKTDEKPTFRSNISVVETKLDMKAQLENSLSEMKEIYRIGGEVATETRQWGMRTSIWTSNVHFLLAIVKQTSSGFKALFHSAG